MTTEIEKTLGLPSLKDALAETEQHEVDELETALTENQNINLMLGNLPDEFKMEDRIHDSEMDLVLEESKKSYEELLAASYSVDPKVAAPWIKGAVDMLRLYKDASDSKINRKLRAINMKLQKDRLDREIPEQPGTNTQDNENLHIVDRTKLIQQITEIRKTIGDK